MRAGKCREHEIARIGMAGRDRHPGAVFDRTTNVQHIPEIQPGIDTLLPLATASETVEKRESSTPDTVDWLWPVALAMLATSSVLVMDLSAMWLSSKARTRAFHYSDRVAHRPRLVGSTVPEYTHIPRSSADFRAS